MQTSQSWSRCAHGQYEGKLSEQEFQDLNLTSKTQVRTGIGKEAIGAGLDSVYKKSFILWKVVSVRLLFQDVLSEMKGN